ncbi:MAG: ScpA family protein [Candidatus Buchananbacteria bacterium]
MYQIKLEQFDGPLDLLLQLIENQKLNISQVSLGKVTDQYLQYLDSLQEVGASDLADFLVIATKLLIIKSKTLLPINEDDEEDSADQLELQLKMYKEYLEATKKIEKIINDKRFAFSRDRIAISHEPTFSPPPSCNTEILRDYFEQIIGRIDYIVNLPQRVLEKVVSLTEVVENIRRNLAGASKLDFKSIISEAKSKSEVVVCFMALLELIKNGEILVGQDGIFDNITVEKI